MLRLALLVSLLVAPVASAKKPDPGYAAAFEQASAAPAEPRAVPEATEPLAWEVGQWVALRLTDASGRVGYRRSSIVAHDECGWWLEAVTTTGTTGQILKVCYAVPAWPRPDTTEPIVRVIRTRNGTGKPTTVDLRTPEGAELAARMGRQFAGAFQPLHYDESVAPGTIAVAGGTFEGSRKVTIEATALGQALVGSGWVHGAVPIFGVVKAESGGVQTELVDYGLTGATSILP
jgi:hypothetical protein